MTTLYAATASGLHTFGERSDLDFEGRGIDALCLDVPGESWAVVDGRELWHDAGAGWEIVARSEGLRLNCVGVEAKGVWVGTSNARLLVLEDEALIPAEGFDAAPGRDEWFTPWGGPPDVRSLAVGDRHLFANVHVGGILRKELQSSSWEPTIQIASDVHEVVTDRDARDHLYAATARGLASSLDHGETWAFDDGGLHSSYARAVAIGGETLFMSASKGPFGGPAAVYRRALDGTGFAKCEEGLPEWFDDNIDTGCVAASGREVAFGTEDGRVFLSGDEGISWEQVRGDLAPLRWVAFGRD